MGDPPNVYIFNKVKNNEADVNLLKNTFQSLSRGRGVRIINDVPLHELQTEVRNMITADFKKCKYVVIVILDNTNKDRNVWETSDKKKFHLNGDLLNNLKFNTSLKNKLVLSIFQNNRTCDPYFNSRREIQDLDGCRFTDVRIYAVESDQMLNQKWEGYGTSTFIRVICEEIKNSKTNNKPIEEILSIVADKVFAETESSEQPVKEVALTDNLSTAFLGYAYTEEG